MESHVSSILHLVFKTLIIMLNALLRNSKETKVSYSRHHYKVTVLFNYHGHDLINNTLPKTKLFVCVCVCVCI